MAGSPATEEYNAAGNNDYSRKVMDLVGWSTPTVQDAENNAGPSQFDRNSHPLNVQAMLAGWTTPRSTDIGRERIPENNQRPGGGMASLEDQVLLAGWATPTAGSENSARGTGQDPLKRKAQGHQVNLMDQSLLALGPTSNSSTAATTSGDESRGVLNPSFSGWLQGFPTIWTLCGLLAARSRGRRNSKGESASCEDSETQSSLKSPSSSSECASDGPKESDDAGT